MSDLINGIRGSVPEAKRHESNRRFTPREEKTMDVTKILEELRREHQQLEEAILSLERLAAGGKRRGRPPAWLAAAQHSNSGAAAPSTAPRGPGRPAGSKNKSKKKKASVAETPEAD